MRRSVNFLMLALLALMAAGLVWAQSQSTPQQNFAGGSGNGLFNPTSAATQVLIQANNFNGASIFSVSSGPAAGSAGQFSFGSSNGLSATYSFPGSTTGIAGTENTSGPDWGINQIYNTTTPTTPVGSTAFGFPANSAAAGLFEISYYSVVTTSGVGGTSFSLNFIYTDAKQAQTVPAFTNSTFTAGNVNNGVFVVQNQTAGTNNISYSITEAGTFSTHPVLALYFVVRRIH